MIKSIHHICIETDCYSKSIDFYCSLLGFNLVEESRNFHGREFCSWIKKGNVIIELQTPKCDAEKKYSNNGNPGIVHVCFSVEDLYRAIELLKEKDFNSFRRKNGEIIYEVKGGKLAKITAPEGTVIELREE